MVAKKSSIRTVVSGSERGVWVVGGLEGEEDVAGLLVGNDVLEGRRGRGGMGSVGCWWVEDVVDARDGLRAWKGSLVIGARVPAP